MMGLTGAVAAMLFGFGAVQAAGGPLQRYLWTSRVLVICAPDENDPGLVAQRAMLGEAGAGVSERDIVIVEALGDTPGAQRLRATLGLPPHAFRVVLIGKDGESKRVESAPTSPADLFETIDAMPMRRQEMQH